ISSGSTASFAPAEELPGTPSMGLTFWGGGKIGPQDASALVDVDRDGLLDLVYDDQSYCPGAQFAFSHAYRDSSRNGMPSYVAIPSFFDVSPALGDWQTYWPSLDLTTTSGSVAVHDVDGDGVADLIISVTSSSGTVSGGLHVHRGYWNGTRWTVTASYLSYP